MAAIIVLSLTIVCLPMVGLLVAAVVLDKGVACKSLPQALSLALDGRQRVTMEAPYGVSAEQLVNAARELGYVLVHTFRGVLSDAPVLVFEREDSGVVRVDQGLVGLGR